MDAPFTLQIGHWLLLACTFAFAIPGSAVDAADHTNIVVILADDMGYGDLGCTGHPKFKTPNLDRMAAEGARLTQFNTSMPFCAPTRASLLTGRYPFRHGLMSNPTPDASPEADRLGLDLGEKTLADLLGAAGYQTAIIGKWHLGHQSQFLPTRRGFGSYFGIPYSNDMRPVKLLRGVETSEYPVVQATLTRRYTTEAITFIERNKDRPFFLYLPHAMPHKPLAASEEFYKKSGAGLYGDAVAELDWSVGQIAAKLKELGIDEKTLVIFTSDNGPWFGGSSGGLRGMKGTSWEGGYRVPFIARWPGKIPAGHVNHAPAVTMDIFATALKATGVPTPVDRLIDGRDLMPIITSDAAGPHEVIFGMAARRVACVRDARWKLHVVKPSAGPVQRTQEKWIDPRGPDGVTILAPYEQYQPTDYPGLQTGDEPQALMLFDLAADPAEQHNVATKHPEEVTRLSGHVERIKLQIDTKPGQ